MPAVRNILIDRGNTYCKVCISDDGQLSEQMIYEELSIEQIAPFCEVAPETSLRALYSAVGREERAVVDFLQHRCDFFVLLNENTPLPLDAVHYDRKQIGADRLALVIGALALVPPQQEILVIDIGTAITYERISAQRAYLGGNISPGPLTRSRSLHTATARLPEVILEESYPLFGDTTERAILSGIMQGITYEIEGYIDQLRSQYPQSTVMLTGGYAPYFVDKLKSMTFVEPNLIMIGLDRLLEYNVQTKQ